MKNAFLISILVATMLLTTFPATPASAEPLCFPDAPDITDCIDGRLREFWEQQGGLRVFGYPLTRAVEQQTANGPVTVQLFERNRLEWHPQNARPYDVLLGRLGADALAQRSDVPTTPQPPQEGCLFFAETNQNICGAFLETWRSYGLELGAPGISQAESIALFGLPLTPPTTMVLSDGQPHTVQWFERARFEDHDVAGVRFGLLGRELADTTPTLPSMPASPVQPAAPVLPTINPQPRPDTPVTVVQQEGVSQEPGGFIRVSGDKLVRFGQEIRFKGVNYYPRGRPWDEMWTKWDSEQMQRELQLGRDRLGINVIRILLPYDVRGDGNVDDELLRRIGEILQIAGDLDMRVIVTLFDFYDGFPPEDARSWPKNRRYAEQIVGNFIGDERIMAWDLHNEPDNYPTWQNGDAPQVLDWLGRMADFIRSIDPNHLITVGMGLYENFYQPGPDGRRVIDYTDFVSVHIYNAPDAQRQIDEIRARTNKPIIIGEFGWPSGPECTVAFFNEQQQAEVYRQVLTAAEGRTTGVIAWTLRDYHAGPTRRWDTREEHYGLFRFDDTLKPAAASFAAYAASPLPVITRTDIPLRGREEGLPESVRYIPESGRHVKDWLLKAWDELGDVGSFGLPINEAYIRESDGKVVQNFTAATLVFDDDEFFGPEFTNLPLFLQIQRLIKPEPIGLVYTAGRQFPPQPPIPPGVNAVFVERTGYAIQGQFLDFYFNFQGEWRLGAPISPEVVEDVNGVPVTMQYFENGRLEFNPQYNIVQFGQIGIPLWEQQCQSPPTEYRH